MGPGVGAGVGAGVGLEQVPKVEGRVNVVVHSVEVAWTRTCIVQH